MKQEKSQTLEAMIIFIVIIAWLIGAITYMQAPDIVPIHWNLEGNPDNFAPKGIGIFLLPLINTGLYVFLLFIPMIDPNNQQLQGSMKTLQWIRLVTHGLLAIIMGWTSLSILESTIVKPEWIFAIVALFLAFLGKVMVNVKQNYFVGIRTPWTLSNEVVWDDTHRFAAPLWLYSGILMTVIISLLIMSGFTAKIILPMFLVWVFTIVIIPIAYSYKRFKEQKNQ
ncbi:MAG: SdpI family protein [Ignavibacteria bacterium]